MPSSASSSSTKPHTKTNAWEMGADMIMQSPTTITASETISTPPLLDSIKTSTRTTMPLAPAPINTARRRRLSKTTTGSVIKRSASTPNVRRLAMGETAMSLADKRRSKLGYHRTSVACVHCRRRKIRCLLAPDDPQNRCLNCIRLKKDCNFYPVDQQPPVERRPRSGSKTDGRSGENSTSSSSSPGYRGGHVIEQVDNFNHYSLPVGAHEYSVSGGPMSAAPITARVFDFPQHPERTNWEPQFFEQGHMGHHHASDDHSNGYWKGNEAPMTPAFSPYTTGPPSAVGQHPPDAGNGFSPYAATRQDAGWPLPGRSMSFSHDGDLPHQYSNQTNYHHQPYLLDNRRRASDMYTPSLQTSANSSNTSMSDITNAPMSTPLTSQPVNHLGLPPAWTTLPSHGKAAEFGGWYSEPSPLAKVQEEDSGAQFGSDPSMLYSTAGRH